MKTETNNIFRDFIRRAAVMLSVMLMTTATAWAQNLTISSTADWNTFANSVNNGTTYEGRTVKLTADISVTTMAGVEGKLFSGIFNGQGHKLTISLNGSGEGTALFYEINGATIQDVIVEGTVTTNQNRPATFAAIASGVCTIKNCWSSVAISSTKTGDWVDGGAFVGRSSNDGTLNITNCLFTGSVTYAPTACSGGSMVGFSQSRSTTNITNCLFSPTAINISQSDYNPHIFVSGDVRGNIVNSYYNAVAKASMLENEGTDASAMSNSELLMALGSDWKLSDGNVIPELASVQVTIGGNMYASNSIPFDLGTSYSLVQQIYTAEEISLQGTITTIAFSYCSSTAFSMSGVHVYLKHTDKNSFESVADMVPVGADDKVFEGTFSATGKGWVSIKLDTPFEYDGVSNLLVCCYDPTYGSIGSDCKFDMDRTNDLKCFHASSPGYSGIVPSLDGSNMAAVSTKNRMSYRNMIRFNICPGTFSKPDNLSVSSCTEEEATLTWTAPETVNPITGYDYQFKKAGDADWSDEVTTTGTSVTFGNLTADTGYDFRVRTIYGSKKSPYQFLNFTTATPLPYEMDFENDMGHWSMVDCYLWDNAIGGTGRKAQAAHESEFGFQFYSSGQKPQYLISPRFSGDKAIKLSFYYRVPTNIAETIYVGYSTTTNDKGAFTFGDAITYKSNNWSKYEHTFPANARYFAIKYTSNQYMMYIDDFCFEEPSSYAKPTTIGYTTIAETKATLEWNIPDGAIGFAYQYKKASDTTWSALATLSANTVTLSGLTPNTYYTFRVQAIYEGRHASNFTTYNFQTDASVVDLPYSDGFENGMGGWRMIGCDGTTRIVKIDDSHSGNYAFCFRNSNEHQYLLSPHFAGGTPIRVSFYYKNHEGYVGVFSVGYTSSKDVAVTWVGKNSLITYDGAWTLYETTLPAETQYVVICCRKEGNILLLDDFKFTKMLELADDADNTMAISDAASLGEMCSIQLSGRTIYRNGDWNTLCLPFAVNNFADTPLEGFAVMELDGTTSSLNNEGTLTLNFNYTNAIEAGKPYIAKWEGADVFIRSIDDWNAFATNVAGGNTYENQTVKLMADIGTSQNPVTTMVSGTFKGTFDGGGHNINAVIRGSGDGTALFYHISGATIKNLRVEGWIKTDGTHPANIAAFVSGVSTISNCSCWADVLSTKKLSKIDGGTVVGLINADATLNMTDIYSRAGITYEYTSSYGGGGMVGWTGSSTTTANLERCLYSPYEVDIQYTGNEPSYYFVSGPGQKNLTKCVYDNNVETSVLTSQGTLLNYNMDDIWKYLTWDMGYDRSLKLPMTVATASADNIVNPVFNNVTIDATAPAPVAFDGGTFTGTYSPLDSTTGLLFDEHNPSNGACRAYLSIDAPALDGFEGWYTDAAITTPVSTIPFDADGTVKLYAKLAGDANGDGKVDAADIVEMVNAMNGNVSTNFNWNNADFDGNHTITDYDINEVVKIIMGE